MTTRTPVPMPDTDAGTTALAALTSDAPAAMATIDPRLLSVDANVRADADLTPDFVDAVRGHGVIVPIIVRRDTLDQPHVIDGQRRTLAAIEAGLASVPIVWTDGVGDEETRIVNQLVINDHRAELRPGHRASAYQQLALIGRSAEAIAKRTSRPVAEVETALAVAGSTVATAAASAHPTMPLDVAAAIAEFEDQPDVVEDITTTFEHEGDARHAIAAARHDREERALVSARMAELTEQGLTAVDETPETAEALSWLTDEPGGAGYPPAIDATKHAESCPQHAMYVHAGWEWSGNVRSLVANARTICLDWKSAGHFKREARNSAGATSGPRSEEEKAERRTLIANNKSSDVEKVTRTEFVVELLKRKTIPAEYVQLVALTLAVQYSAHDELAEAARLMGSDEGSRSPQMLTRLATDRGSKAFLLALSIARIEGTLPRDYWRSPSDSQLLRPYFEQLVKWGYTLGEVEKLALKGTKKARR